MFIVGCKGSDFLDVKQENRPLKFAHSPTLFEPLPIVQRAYALLNLTSNPIVQ